MYYERAARKCESFHNCNPTKLSVGLHQALYAADCLKDLPRAIKVAELTMNKALGQINTCQVEDDYVETLHMVELLRENIAGWKGEDPSLLKHD